MVKKSEHGMPFLEIPQIDKSRILKAVLPEFKKQCNECTVRYFDQRKKIKSIRDELEYAVAELAVITKELEFLEQCVTTQEKS